MKRIYVAGPMTGTPDYNYPAFARAAANLRALGYHVESPHEPGQVDGWGWADYMRRGLAQMLTCDTIALLPRWHESRGAMIELRLAESLGMRSILIDHDGEPTALGDTPEAARPAESIVTTAHYGRADG